MTDNQRFFLPSTSLVGALSLSLVLASCGEPDVELPIDGPPHIVVVLIDTLRADHTSLHGYERETTPNLERLAREGAWMKKHFTNAPWTKPSVASILTGLHPTAHGSRIGQLSMKEDGPKPRVEVLDERHTTFVEVLQDAGYATKAHVSNYNLLPKWGYDQGYDEYRLVDRATNKVVLQSDRDAVDFALDALDDADRPTFVWAHLMAVHQYLAPPEHRIFESAGETPIDREARGANRVGAWSTLEKAVDAYDQSIHYCDALVGKLYDEIVAEHPNTILIVTSDHGEEFYEHGGFEHCSTLYNEMLRVPLVVVGPRVPKGAVVDGITDSLDLFPSILSLAGIEVDGIARVGQVIVDESAVTEGKAETFAEQHHRGPFVRFALNRDGSKLIESYQKRGKKEGAERIGEIRDLEWFTGAWGPEDDGMLWTPPESDSRDFRERVQLYRETTSKWFENSVGEQAYGDVTAEDLENLKALGYGGDD